ncbi:ESF1 homolog [Cololabis saira]|uniref:ESF1 homolog n=1 Tax=Cololabis saira TaxID=129043 RepID=UPI002AD31DFB|nr:ESF1 homolog [Cololabis saira]
MTASLYPSPVQYTVPEFKSFPFPEKEFDIGVFKIGFSKAGFYPSLKKGSGLEEIHSGLQPRKPIAKNATVPSGLQGTFFRVYREKMRDYQFKQGFRPCKRLKYFYAVVECDSVDTAAKIYEECDGYEYESSCSVMDLRFIPDDLAFDEEPKDVAMDVNVSLYTPKLFTSSAAASSKVQLTWDETDHERVTALNRKFNKDELLDMDFKAYLASSSEEEDGEEQESEEEAPPAEEEPAELQEKPQEEEENMKQRMKKNKKSEEQISKYRELLKGIKV